MRLCSCMGLGLDIIEPCGFILDNRKLRRSGMDYVNNLDVLKHSSWNKFLETYKNKKRIILLTTQTKTLYTEFVFAESDILLAGQESAGVTEEVKSTIDEAITIPMPGQGRSLNVVNAIAMVTGEAIRQLGVQNHGS